jgi:hypothetical protein
VSPPEEGRSDCASGRDRGVGVTVRVRDGRGNLAPVFYTWSCLLGLVWAIWASTHLSEAGLLGGSPPKIEAFLEAVIF